MADKPDDFDEIVQRLDLDLPFPDDAVSEERPKREPEHPSVRRHRRSEPPPEAEADEPESFDDMPDEPFYRKVPPAPIRPRHRGRTLAWIAVLCSPMSIIVFTVAQVWLPKSVMLGIGLTFVAGSIYLISQLPEHGPGRPDWPDDGAEL
jgi:hypothetical protein